MIFLDCEDKYTALKSLSCIFDINANELIRIIKFASYATLSSGYKKKCDGINDPLLLFLLQRGYKINNIDGVCWFHFTRHWDLNSFYDGLLPLSSNLNTIWAYLSELAVQCGARSDVIKNARIAAENSPDHSQYKRRVNKPHGPYAFLLGNPKAHLEIWQSHYFMKSPEIVMAILEFFGPEYHTQLNTLYYSSTKPIRIKFFDKNYDDQIISTALSFCKISFCKNDKMGAFQNTCYNSKGTSIHRNNIAKVESFDA